jgi:hypothetical protein
LARGDGRRRQPTCVIHFAVNGTTQPSQTVIKITAAQLASYVSGAARDQLYVRANDGAIWSAWVPFMANSSEPAIVNAGATRELPGAYGKQVTFLGNTGTLKLDHSSSFNGTVAGMSGQDTLSLADINPLTVQTPTYAGTSSGGTLTVTDGTLSGTIALLGNYLASVFIASSDGHGGTSVVDPPALGSVQPLMMTPHTWDYPELLAAVLLQCIGPL